LYAVKPGATGDISSVAPPAAPAAAGSAPPPPQPAAAPLQPTSPFVSWFQPRLSAYTGSPLFYRGRLYVVNDNGIMQVVNAATGAEVYKIRVGGAGNTFSSSPFASDGRIFIVSEDGDTFVFKAGDEYVELAKNSLGEMSLATPAAYDNSLFIRTQTKLFRVGTRPASR
jgi:outer membrane protein assembly factor BamB